MMKLNETDLQRLAELIEQIANKHIKLYLNSRYGKRRV